MMDTDADNGRNLAPPSGGDESTPDEAIRRINPALAGSEVEPAPEPSATRIQEAPPPPAPPPSQPSLGGTRASAVWTATAVAIVVLVLLAIFIAQNTRDVEVRYFTATGRAPLSVALLLATVLGMLVVLLAGAARILQLRMRARRASRSADASSTAGRFGRHRHQA